jgi:hypothetical protein
MMLIDKQYYDYDFENFEQVVTLQPRSDEEIKKRLARFGIGQKAQTAEDIQRIVIEDKHGR